ncbi:regulatory protein RecX [Rhabdochlamydiaceae symbiont of Dictyostelium giganteum]|uniref:regulatory protein RecX n=1 Tax=Rhabdochlamydiaceae symbiont of Dictyostelium giganteum TaxID=3342349 RepID=UPI003850ADD6
MIEKTALRLLGIKNRSQEELRQKLLAKGFPLSEINGIIQKLVDLGYIQDENTTKTRFQMYLNRGYGPRYIKIKLKQQGLLMPPYSLELQKKVATKLLENPSLQKKDQKQKAALLSRRGFDLDLIYALVMED